MKTCSGTERAKPFVRYATVLLLFVLFCNCKVQKPLILLSDLQPGETFRLHAYQDSIQPGDILSIHISASETSSLRMFGSAFTDANGFKADVSGFIDLPVFGRLMVKDISLDSLNRLLKYKALPYLRDPIITTYYKNYKVTVLNTLNKSLILSDPTGYIRLTDVLSAATSITQTQSSEIKILRTKNGTVAASTIDMRSKSFFESPYYFLKQNDIVIIDMDAVKMHQLMKEEKARQILPYIMSGISVVTGLIVLITNLTR